jgi:hypothetical protein
MLRLLIIQGAPLRRREVAEGGFNPILWTFLLEPPEKKSPRGVVDYPLL